ncbi:MAG: phosphate acyltransferase PlsX [Verrucomicrobiales bacterium]
MKIALDAMGGDFGPPHNIAGAKLALADNHHIEKLFLVGDEALLKAEVDAQGLSDRRVEIVHASQVVTMHDPATAAVRGKKDSSITVAADLVKRGESEAVVSAGHTGAAVAATTVKFRLLPGVERAGIASPIPNDHGICNLIDAGANPEAKPIHLLQYAIMGSVYARHVQGVPKPRVGLMSVGEEDSKGTEFTREVFALLRESNLNFKGNIEGHDLFESEIHVVVCDGFVGNVILKSCEATAKAMMKWLKRELMAKPVRKFGAMLAKGGFAAVKDRISADTYGGSPLLGVNGICIIGHGSSSPLAIKNAILAASEAIRHGVNPHIQDEIAKFDLAHA